MLELILGQLVALFAFFAFPIIQYFLLKRTARREGMPELWYLPSYGFRLVIRNIPEKRIFYDIRYRSLIRELTPPDSGSSVGSCNDYMLSNVNDYFLFPGSDQLLIEFCLDEDEDGELSLIRINKTSEKQDRVAFPPTAKLIADYQATLQNWFHFDVRVSKRVEITHQDLRTAFKRIQEHNHEQKFKVSRVREVG